MQFDDLKCNRLKKMLQHEHTRAARRATALQLSLIKLKSIEVEILANRAPKRDPTEVI